MDIADWRRRIDQLDSQLLALLNQRAGYVLKLAPLKRQQAIPVHEPKREEDVVAKVTGQNGGPLTDEAVQRIFQRIMEEMRAVQTQALPAAAEDSRAPAKPVSSGGREAKRRSR